MRRLTTALGGSRYYRKWKWCTWVVSIGTLVLLALHSRAANAQALTPLCSFNGSNGGYSSADLTLSGNMLYGTTAYGGAYGDGVVFSLPVSGGSPTVLTSFNGSNGQWPYYGALVLSGNTLYGTTSHGGAYGDGTVFSLPVSGGSPTVLASFNDCPFAGLTLSGNMLYGTTIGGGASGDGTVFSLPVTGGSPTVLASFNGSNGKSPEATLTLSGNTLYGTTAYGGANGDGTVFSVPITGGSPTVLTSFNASSGEYPNAITLAGGMLYGTNTEGGNLSLNNGFGYGTVFSLSVSGGSPTVLASFNGSNGGAPDSILTLSGNTLYGTTNGGGVYGDGTVFSIPTSGGTPTVLASFNGSNGNGPLAGVTFSGNTLYGTTEMGGAYGDGTVFCLQINSSERTWIVDAGGNWSAVANWDNGTANGSNVQVNFLGAITALRTVTVDAAVTAGALVFDSSNQYTIAGSQAITLQASPGNAAIDVVNGSHAISTPLILASATDVTVSNAADTLTLSGNISGAGMALNKYGAGTLILGGSNTNSGNTTISAGTVTLANPLAAQNSTVNLTNSGTLGFAAGNTSPILGGLTGPGNIALTTAAAEPVTLNVGNNGQSTTYGGVLSGAGGLTKQGAGTLALTAANTYNGATVISGGVLQLQAPGAGGGIGIHFVGGGSPVTGSAGVVAINNWNNESGYIFSGSTLANNSGQNSGATFSLSGAANTWATGSANQVLNGYVYVDNYNSMTLAVNNIPYARYSIYACVGDSSTGNQEMATINGTSYYYSTEGGTPITYTPISSRSSSNYQSGNYIEVEGLTGSSQTVTVAGTTQEFGGLCSVEIVNTTPVVGDINILPPTSALRIAAGSTLDLDGASQQAASLSDNTPGRGGSIINSSSAPSVLTLSPSGGSTTFSGTIQGSGSLSAISLVINGSGTQVLAGRNTYTGPTTINQGTLLVNGLLASPVTVNSGGMLGGSGSLSSVTVASGGSLSPGAAPNPMSVSGSLSLLSGAKMDYALETPTDSDELYMPSGPLVLSGQQFADFNFTPLAGFGPGTYTLIDTSSVPVGSLGTSTSGTIDGLPANIAIQGDDVVLTVVPEPGTLVLLGVGAVGLVGWGWRRRQNASTRITVRRNLGGDSR